MSDSNVADLKPAKKPKVDKPAAADSTPATSTPVLTDPGPAPDETPRLIYCWMCVHWKPSSPVRPAQHSAFGECLLSGKALSAPMMTTDLSTCTMAKEHS